ncbi:Ulp1 protease family, C-terminal catalytic domain [Musa troglodytarum]|uniref:Ulp1 protease family, C-terminal catalytic domain n=1 Tax=Musa troglodytarum TaxID=320322 RepID=A0A9E7H2L9_9LILI|nr:Ulp1 protease family, C-terminal catalytic domain [Musa troglodytarum]
MHKRDNDRDSYAVDVPEQGLALNYEKAELDEIMASSTSYDEHGQMHPDEFEDGMVVDVTSDDEESLFLISGSESSAASDSGEDEGCLECSDSETCYAATGDVFSNQMGIKIFPDYVIHGSTSYGESQVVFSADCIKIKCSDAIGSDEKFSSEWAVADIVHIVCRWSGSFLEVRFSVNDMCWMDKEQRIRNLAARYEHIWNASFGYLENKIQPNQKHKFHFFNSFFYRKLVGKDQGGVSEGREAFLRVHNEIESDKVPCILHMDSIKGCHSGLQKIIQSYIWEEWKERHPETTEDDSWKFLKLRFVSPELPQQENSFDCGLFLLHYVELFLKEVPVNFDLFKITRFSSFLSAKWFPPVEASLKRSVIRKLIYELLNDRSEKIDRSTCSTGCPSTSGHPEDNTERELLAAHCSPAMGVMGDAICQDTEDGEKLVAVEDSQEADKTKAVCRVCEGCQKICASEADCQIVDGREITTNANEVDVTDCQVPSAIGAVDREDGGCELDTNEAEGEDGKDCGETTSNAVRQDDKSSVIHITEVESGDGSCQENRPSFEGVIITVDETSSDDNDDVRVTHKKPVQKLRKRGKVMIPEGRRVRTRSVTKAQHNDT